MLSTEKALGLAVERQHASQFEEAEAIYREILAQDPSNADAVHLLGMLESERGRHEAAVGYVALAIALNPRVWYYHHNLGNVLQQLGRYRDAVLCYEEALHLGEANPESLNNLGNALASWGSALRTLNRLPEAAGCFEEALRLRPEDAELHNHLGTLREELGARQEALGCYRCAVAHNPGCAEAHLNLGRLLREQGQLEEAEECLETAIRLKPDLAEAHHNLGSVWRAEGRLTEGLTLLAGGDFERGWPEYAWRLRRPGVQPRQFSQPAWDGASLEGRTILLHAEQGLGDTIQLVRYAPLVRERGGRVLLECQPLLVRLLETVHGIDQVIPAGLPLPDFDVQASLLDLPGIFGTRLETIPAEVPYLGPASAVRSLTVAAPQAFPSHDREGVDSGGHAPAVGLVWAEDPGHAEDRNRSLKLSQLAPLGQVPEVEFFSLQKGPQAAELLAPRSGLRVTGLTGNLVDFADTASAILGLDLVITVDTAVAHLAGALGRPVWTLLPFAPDWRWLLEREDSPWYPSMRLFRQPRPGDWAAVIEKVAARLSDAYHS